VVHGGVCATEPGPLFARTVPQPVFALGGKTTFLKFAAIECVRGTFRPELIPVFVTLREYAETNGSPTLPDYIGTLWGERRPWSVLKAGRALILLDGLDEVRDHDFDRIRKSINEFAVEFDLCPMILTCRIAAREYVFEQFAEVEMSDFSDEQIRIFAQRWFDSQNERQAVQPFAERLWANHHALELASNPLLLTLLCLVFQERRDFGETRAMLYREGLEILLKEMGRQTRHSA
jgi:predicted NACHT family NTPase